MWMWTRAALSQPRWGPPPPGLVIRARAVSRTTFEPASARDGDGDAVTCQPGRVASVAMAEAGERQSDGMAADGARKPHGRRARQAD